MAVNQHINLGTSVVNKQMEIDPDNDMYPIPLYNKGGIRKVSGYDRLLYPIMYHCINRVVFLLAKLKDGVYEDINLFEVDFYGQNIIALITEHNMGDNIMYDTNKQKYHKMIMVILRFTSQKNLDKLFADIVLAETKWGTTMIGNIMKNVKDRPHILLALWNHGLIIPQEYITEEYIYSAKIRNILTQYGNAPVPRYRSLNQECPITLETFHTPCILNDGYVYESSAIIQYLKHNDNSPMTQEPFIIASGSTVYKKNGEWVGKPISNKFVYLPTEFIIMEYI
jgi:hypothetical protein